MRLYKCYYYIGDESGEFYFYSDYRAKSKANMHDAKMHYYNNYQHANIEIIDIIKVDEKGGLV